MPSAAEGQPLAPHLPIGPPEIQPIAAAQQQGPPEPNVPPAVAEPQAAAAAQPQAPHAAPVAPAVIQNNSAAASAQTSAIGARQSIAKLQLIGVLIAIVMWVGVFACAVAFDSTVAKVLAVLLGSGLVLGSIWIFYVPWQTHARAVRGQMRDRPAKFWEVLRRLFLKSEVPPTGWTRHDEHLLRETALKPEQYSGAPIIDEQQKSLHREAGYQKWRYHGAAIPLAVLPALSAFFLAVETRVTSADVAWGAALALNAAVMLFVLVVCGLCYKHPTADWLKRRVASEILRREQFLCVAQVGPYAKASDSEPKLKDVAQARVEEVRSQTLEMLIERYLPLQDESGVWIEQVWRSTAALPRLVERIETYRIHRIRDQLAWYTRDYNRASNKSSLFLWPLVGAMVLSFALALAHFLMLWVNFGWPAGVAGTPSATASAALPVVTTQPVETAIALCAIGAALLSGALLALRSLFALAPQAAIYGKVITRLARIERECNLLKHNDEGHDEALRSRLYQSLVLRTEGLLTAELEEWMSAVDHRDFEVV